MRALSWILARTPLPVAAAFAATVAWLWWGLVPYRRRLAEESFRASFPGRAPGGDLRRMARGIVLGYFELLREQRRPGTVRLDIEGAEALLERSLSGAGSLLLIGHLGSWDLIGNLVPRRTGLPMAVVAKVPHSPGAAALIAQVRSSFGLGSLAPDERALRRVVKLLAEGQVVIFALDQNHPGGLPVPFFGRPALASTALAAVAARRGVPVYFCEFWREGTGHHRAVFTGPLPTTGRIEDDTAFFTRHLEEAVRRRPHNWFWLHDRWKGVP